MADKKEYYLLAFQEGNKLFEIELTEEEYFIGRVKHPNGIHLEHDSVSSKHATIYKDNDVYFIEDLGSTNGTTINGHRLKADIPQPLNHEDEINIPSLPTIFVLQVRFGPAVVEKAPPVISKPAEPDPTPPSAEKVKSKKPAVKKSPPKQKTVPTRVISGQDSSLFQTEFANGHGIGFVPPPTLTSKSKVSRYLNYLPSIYHTDFMRRFMLLFESIYGPLEWTVENFDLYLDPHSAPFDFLRWFATWYEYVFDDSWSEAQQRIFFQQAHMIYRRKGTKWALEEMLKLYAGDRVEVDDTGKKLDPFSFKVNIKAKNVELNEASLRHIIELHKPAHATYELVFRD